MTPLEVLQAYVAGNGYEIIALNDGSRTAMPMKDEEAEAALAAVLNLIEAARHWKEINDKAEERGVSQDTGTFIAWQDFCEALAVFVSGQEESA